MVTIGSGGIPKLGGGMKAMDILSRLGIKRGAAADAGAAPMSAAPMPAAAMPEIRTATPPMADSGRPEPQALLSVAPTESSGMGTMAPMQAGKRFSDPSIMNRIGDFVQSDRGRATLLRSGAATLQGGLGAGIMAGAQYNDDEKEKEAKQMNWVSEMGLKTRNTDIDQQNADQTGQYQMARADIDSSQTAINAAVARENARKNRATEGIDVMEESGRNVRFGIGDETQRRGQDVTVRGQDVSMRNTDVNADTSRYATDSSRITADTNRAYQYGDTATATSELPNGVKLQVNRRAPDYGQNLRYDDQGNAYYLDKLTGKPVRADRR